MTLSSPGDHDAGCPCAACVAERHAELLARIGAIDDGVPRVLTVTQAAEWLQVSAATVQREIRLGRLPALKVGRGYRLSARAVSDLLASPQAPSEPPPPTSASRTAG